MALPQVLILAAGRGSRFRSAGGGNHKSLAAVESTTPLLWTLDALAAAGAPKVRLVLGCDRDAVWAAVEGAAYPGVIDFVVNEDWESTDSAYSFGLGAAGLPGPIVLTYADVLLTPALVQRILRCDDRDFAAVDATRPPGSRDMHAEVGNSRVLRLGKTLPKAARHGESACLFRFQPQTAAMLGRRGRGVLGQTPPVQFERMLSAVLADLTVEPLWCAPMQWCEVDVPGDLTAAAALIKRARAGRLAAGTVIEHRELLDGEPWLRYSVRVVRDDDEALAVYLAQGELLRFGDGPFRWGPHPWRKTGDRWRDPGVLKLHPRGKRHSIWTMRNRDNAFTGWYINLEAELARDGSGISTLDHELDLVLSADGSGYRWKDVGKFEDRVARGEFTSAEAGAIRAEAACVARRLDKGDRWWKESWANWRPPAEWGPVW
jgi:choline kinase